MLNIKIQIKNQSIKVNDFLSSKNFQKELKDQFFNIKTQNINPFSYENYNNTDIENIKKFIEKNKNDDLSDLVKLVNDFENFLFSVTQNIEITRRFNFKKSKNHFKYIESLEFNDIGIDFFLRNEDQFSFNNDEYNSFCKIKYLIELIEKNTSLY